MRITGCCFLILLLHFLVCSMQEVTGNIKYYLPPELQEYVIRYTFPSCEIQSGSTGIFLLKSPLKMAVVQLPLFLDDQKNPWYLIPHNLNELASNDKEKKRERSSYYLFNTYVINDTTHLRLGIRSLSLGWRLYKPSHVSSLKDTFAVVFDGPNSLNMMLIGMNCSIRKNDNETITPFVGLIKNVYHLPTKHSQKEAERYPYNYKKWDYLSARLVKGYISACALHYKRGRIAVACHNSIKQEKGSTISLFDFVQQKKRVWTKKNASQIQLIGTCFLRDEYITRLSFITSHTLSVVTHLHNWYIVAFVANQLSLQSYKQSVQQGKIIDCAIDPLNPWYATFIIESLKEKKRSLWYADFRIPGILFSHPYRVTPSVNHVWMYNKHFACIESGKVSRGIYPIDTLHF